MTTLRALIAPLLLGLLTLLAAGCRDTPDEVLRKASEAAAADDLVEMRTLFSVASSHRLQESWRLSNVTKDSGWSALASRLVFDGKALEVDPNDVEIQGEYARVGARAGADTRDYYLRKEDGLWRIELGGGIRFRKAKKANAPDDAKEETEE